MKDFFTTFNAAHESLIQDLKRYGGSVHSRFWQALEIETKPEAEMVELINVWLQVPMLHEDLGEYQKDIQPNLTWADDHFLLERVSGQPKNPGETWRYWPWGLAADKHRTEGDQFSHTYAERYWPKFAGMTPGGLLEALEPVSPHRGIRYSYGDLEDVVELLVNDPDTRQAYLPIFFPEDTGAVHGQRVPCTLGYHFIRRSDHLHCFYPIRSCDLVRHIRDDWYLTVRLVLWVLNRLREFDHESWGKVTPGIFSTWIGSLHCFINDFRQL